MKIEATIDLGQVIISTFLFLLGIIAFFIKKEITTFKTQLNKHETIIIDLVGKVQNLIGFVTGLQQAWNGKIDRRHNS